MKSWRCLHSQFEEEGTRGSECDMSFPGPLSHRKEAPGSEADRVMPESATGSPASGQSQVRHITQEASLDIVHQGFKVKTRKEEK